MFLIRPAADYNSAFPAGVNVAATFNRGLAYARGQAMGQEHRGKGVDVQLGPVAGPLGRAPAGGRNWEGFRYSIRSLLRNDGFPELTYLQSRSSIDRYNDGTDYPRHPGSRRYSLREALHPKRTGTFSSSPRIRWIWFYDQRQSKF